VTTDEGGGNQDWGNSLSPGHEASPDDEVLMGELRLAAARCDPLPGNLGGLLSGLLAWRDPEAGLAELVADSRDLAGAVRAGPADILVRFEAPPIAVTFEASADGSGRFRLVGQLEPGEPGEVTVVSADSSEVPSGATAHCDQWGRFELYPVGPGPLSLRLALASGATVRTAWTVLR
jgi:hypothetical protein